MIGDRELNVAAGEDTVDDRDGLELAAIPDPGPGAERRNAILLSPPFALDPRGLP